MEISALGGGGGGSHLFRPSYVFVRNGAVFLNEVKSKTSGDISLGRSHLFRPPYVFVRNGAVFLNEVKSKKLSCYFVVSWLFNKWRYQPSVLQVLAV